MKRANTFGRFAVWLAILGFCLPAVPAYSEDIAVPVRMGTVIADVALAPGGVLVGHVVDAQGNPTSATLVTILRGNREVARTTTDANGSYTIQGLQGGIYHVIAGQGVQMCRLWVDRTAPPSARHGLLVVSNPTAVLAQWGPGSTGTFLENAKYAMTNPFVVAGVVAAAVAIPVAIHNSKDGS